MSPDDRDRNTGGDADRRYGDDRDLPRDFPETRREAGVDERKEGFHTIEISGEKPDADTPPQYRRTGEGSTATQSPAENPNRTPGDGTLQDAVPAGLSSEELRRRAEDTEGSAQPGTG